MEQFIEKLIGRLKKYQIEYKSGFGELTDETVFRVMENVIYTVNELAEEHKDNVMIDGQYCWQTCGATENCKECNRLCNGSIDYYENYDCLVEE